MIGCVLKYLRKIFSKSSVKFYTLFLKSYLLYFPVFDKRLHRKDACMYFQLHVIPLHGKAGREGQKDQDNIREMTIGLNSYFDKATVCYIFRIICESFL